MQPFGSLSKDKKIDFFVECQRLLKEFHPHNPFCLRQNDIINKMSYVRQFFNQYKGFCFMDGKVCILCNRIFVSDANEPALTVRDNIWKDPDPNYNALSIDFVVFRDKMDCLPFVRAHYEPRLQYVVFVKNNTPKIYPTTKFIARLLEIPHA